MRVLLATGFTDLEKNLSEMLNSRGDECWRCYHRTAVTAAAEQHGVDVVVLGPALHGEQDLMEDVVLPLRQKGIRIVFLPGEVNMPDAREWLKKLVPYGIYCYVFDPATPASVLERLYKPGTLGELPQMIKEAVKVNPEVNALLEETFGEIDEVVEREKEEALQKKRRGFFGKVNIDKFQHLKKLREVFSEYKPRGTPEEKGSFRMVTEPPTAKPHPERRPASGPKKSRAAVIANGQVKEAPTGEVLDSLGPDTEAVFIPPDLDLLKEIRRNPKALAVPVFVVSRYDRRFVESGADDCVEAVDASAIERARAQSEKMKALWEKANRDPLTGCYTRAFLDAWLEEKEAEYKKTGVPFTIMIADLDHFKQVNDTYGHQAGDEVLKEFGKFLRASVRQVDVVARYGGEEFVVAFAGLKNALTIAERICREWAELEISLPGGEKIHSTFSAGLAVMGRDAGDVDALLGAADRALYRAKESGRNLVIAGDNISSERDKVFKKSPPFKKKSVEFEKKIRAPADIEYAIDEIKRHGVIVVWNLDGWGKADSAIEITAKLQKYKRRVLLVEMDFLNPAIDRIAGIPIVKKKDIPGKSVTEIGAGLLTLGSQLEPEHAVGLIRQRHGSLKVDYLAAGNDLGVTGEYASEQVYHDMVALLAKQYEHVVIDLGVNTDNQVFRGVVKRADILVIPASNNTISYTRYEKIVSVKEAIFVKRN